MAEGSSGMVGYSGVVGNPGVMTEARMEEVRAKIRDIFLIILPDQELYDLVHKEIQNYMSPQAYGSPTDFKSVVRRILEERVRKMLLEILAEPDWQHQWEQSRVVASEQIKKFLLEHAQEIIAASIGDMFQQALDKFKEQLRH